MNRWVLRLFCSVIIAAAACAATPGTAPPTDYVADGRATFAQLSQRYESLAKRYGWQQETIYAYP